MENGKQETGVNNRAAYGSFNLAGADEMWEQLKDLHNSGSDQERFLQEVVLEKAGARVTGVGLTIALAQNIGEFVDSNQLPEVVDIILLIKVPDYLAALIPDPEVRADSINFWEEVMGQIKYEDSLWDPHPPQLPRKLKKAINKPASALNASEQARVQAFRRRLGQGAIRR